MPASFIKSLILTVLIAFQFVGINTSFSILLNISLGVMVLVAGIFVYRGLVKRLATKEDVLNNKQAHNPT